MFTVGKVIFVVEVIIAEERKSLFPISLIGTTIQDSGLKREKDAHDSHIILFINIHLAGLQFSL